MYGYVLDVLIWSFAIYGFISFMQEYFLEVICYCILKCIYIVKLSLKYIVKKIR